MSGDKLQTMAGSIGSEADAPMRCGRGWAEQAATGAVKSIPRKAELALNLPASNPRFALVFDLTEFNAFNFYRDLYHN